MAQRIAILGAGESGVGAALLAQHKGYECFVSDAGKVKPKFATELEQAGIAFESGLHTAEEILHADLIVKSPGIPNTAALVQQAIQKGIPVISEIEFGFQHCTGKCIGITGTNGKTTTTALTYHILRNAGLDVGLGGNIGQSFARQLIDSQPAYWVLEVSSFQLDNIDTFRPYIGMILNITPDHLDRYQYDFQQYVDAKFRLIENQQAGDYFIYNLDDTTITQRLQTINSQSTHIPFSLTQPVAEGAYLAQDQIIINHQQNAFTMSINDLALQGKHNQSNSMAAGIAARILEIRKDNLRDSLSDFKNVSHRLELVSKIAGVEYVNDSKATNVNSTWYALESMERPVIWIAGGVDKGNDYKVLEDMVAKKVKAIVCLGVDNLRIHDAFSNKVDIIMNTSSMKEAVQMAAHLANSDDIVLLSPACASFDLFENYEDRGNQFIGAVREL